MQAWSMITTIKNQILSKRDIKEIYQSRQEDLSKIIFKNNFKLNKDLN